MEFHFTYLFYSVSLALAFGIYFFVLNNKKRRSPDNIQKMIKDLENKIIKA